MNGRCNGSDDETVTYVLYLSSLLPSSNLCTKSSFPQLRLQALGARYKSCPVPLSCSVPTVTGATVGGCTQGGTVDDGTVCTWTAEATHTCTGMQATCNNGVFSQTPSCALRTLFVFFARDRCAGWILAKADVASSLLI